LIKASEENNIDTTKCFMVGDRIMDVKAGKKVNCKTVLISTDYGLKELEESSVKPDFIAKDLLEASKWIIENYNI
jgi:phosphoglycolate phosphatase-like HAD superfamily hydrolase